MIALAQIADAPHLCAALESADRIAIDTEFHSERRYRPALYLIQLKLPSGETWLIDPLTNGLVASLADALLKPAWILHGGRWDMEILQSALGGLPAVIRDTQIAAGLVTAAFPVGYEALVREHLQIAVDKSETLSDWSRRPLSESQLAYAAADVELLGDLWDALDALLQARGRQAWAEAAFAEARALAIDPPAPDVAWQRLDARVALSPPQLAALRALAAWRQERAAAQNQPLRSILSDGAMIDLARRRPNDRAALLANRRLPRSITKTPEPLLEQIRAARALPESAWPRAIHRRTPQARQVAFLQLWAETFAVEHQVAATLVLPTQRIHDLVLQRPQTLAGVRAVLGEWRTELLGDDVLDALHGRRAVTLRAGDLSNISAS